MGRLANIFRQSGCRSFAEAGWQPVGQVGSHFIVVKSGRPRQSFHSAAPRAVGGYIAQTHPCVRHDSRGFFDLGAERTFAILPLGTRKKGQMVCASQAVWNS